MDTGYETLIQKERELISLLQKQIAKREQNIRLLQELMADQKRGDLLFRSLTSEGSGVGSVLRSIVSPALGRGDSFAVPQAAQPLSHFEDPKRRLSDIAQKILRFIGNEERSLDDLESFCEREGLKQSRSGLRSMMSNYKVKHGFIEANARGLFSLTDRAKVFLNKNYPLGEVSSVGPEDTSCS